MYIPDKSILEDFLLRVENNQDVPESHIEWIIKCFNYIIQFDEFISSNTNAAHIIRQVGKYVEVIINRYMLNDSIDVDAALEAGEVISLILIMTDHVAGFDVDLHEITISDLLDITSE